MVSQTSKGKHSQSFLNTGVGLALGASVGVAFGSIAIGAAIGMVVGAMLEKKGG